MILEGYDRRLGRVHHPTRRDQVMNLGVSKAALGKSMRVATVFTGVTACAAAFAPTANPQPADKSAPRAALRAVKGAGIRSGDCTGVPSWVHVYYPGGGATCFGYQGTYSITSPAWASGFCGGNNYGYLSGVNESDRHRTQDFGPAAEYPNSIYYFAPARFPDGLFLVSKVHITRWSGNGPCPA